MATAIVTAGAGARGAYEAGVLSVVVPKLLEEKREEVVLVGTSAGAINTAIIAAHASEGAAAAAEKLEQTWRSLDMKSVYRGDPGSIFAYMAEFAGLPKFESYGLLDTAPLRKLATEVIDWNAFPSNFGQWLKAAGVVATKASSGESVVFVQGLGDRQRLPPDDLARGIAYRSAELSAAHVLASSAIPIAFPSVEIDHDFYLDGGVRLNTPISPAIDLLSKVSPTGPNRMIVVSTVPDPDRVSRSSSPRALRPARPDILAEAAMLLHSMLVDRVPEDLLSLRRVNAIARGASVADSRSGKSGQSFYVIEHAYFGPPSSDAITAAVTETWKAHSALRTPVTVEFISRAFGRGTTHDQLLSYILFDRAYLNELVDSGQRDAKAALEKGFPWRV